MNITVFTLFIELYRMTMQTWMHKENIWHRKIWKMSTPRYVAEHPQQIVETTPILY